MPEIGKPFLVIPVDPGAMVCSSANNGHPLSNLAEFKAPGTTWKVGEIGSHWLRGTFGTSRSIDFCALIAANATPDTTFRLRLGTSQAEVDGGSAPYDSGVLDFIATAPEVTPDDGLYHSHLELPAAQNATWWRIDIAGHSGLFEASMLVMGKKITPSRFYNLDYEQGVEDLGDMDVSRWGVMDEEPGLVWRTIDFTLSWLTEAEFEGQFRPLMQRIGRREPVYLCFDSTDSPWRQARTYMGVLKKPLFARGVKKPRTFQQEFSLLSFI